jgi:hypothetical protein
MEGATRSSISRLLAPKQKRALAPRGSHVKPLPFGTAPAGAEAEAAPRALPKRLYVMLTVTYKTSHHLMNNSVSISMCWNQFVFSKIKIRID